MSYDPFENAHTPVDIDNLEVDILILAKNENALKATAEYLTRHGWPTKVMSNLSMAIEYIAEHKPDIVVASFNHPSPAIHRLPELITQTFNLICVGFSEQNDSASQQKLTQVKMPHKVFGTTSGPNFNRTLRKILGEKFGIQVDEKAAPEEIFDVPEKTSNSIPMRKGQKAGDKRMIIQSAVKGPGATGRAQAESDEESSEPSPFVVKGKRRSLKELTLSQAAATAAGNMLFGESVDKDQPAAEPAKESAPDLVGMIKQSLFGEGGPGAEEEGRSVDTPLAAAVDKAFAQVCQRNPDVKATVLTNVKRVGAFPIESTTIPGYLVLAFEFLQEDDHEHLLKDCMQALQVVFQTMAVDAKVQQGFWLELPETPYQPWVENSTVFNFKMDHNGAEMGIAFFQSERQLPKVTAAPEAGMSRISVDDISTEVPVNFKAYLHLKANNKYLLYLRNGRRLQPEQKARLKERNISEIFMKDIDLENLRVFLATAFLSRTIKDKKSAA